MGMPVILHDDTTSSLFRKNVRREIQLNGFRWTTVLLTTLTKENSTRLPEIKTWSNFRSNKTGGSVPKKLEIVFVLESHPCLTGTSESTTLLLSYFLPDLAIKGFLSLLLKDSHRVLEPCLRQWKFAHVFNPTRCIGLPHHGPIGVGAIHGCVSIEDVAVAITIVNSVTIAATVSGECIRIGLILDCDNRMSGGCCSIIVAWCE